MPWLYELTGRQLESLCANIGTLPSEPRAQCLPRVPRIIRVQTTPRVPSIPRVPTIP